MGLDDLEDFLRRMRDDHDDDEDEESEKYKTWTDKVTAISEEQKRKLKGSQGQLRAGQICKIYSGTAPDKRLDNMELGKRRGAALLLTKIQNGKEAELWLVRYWDDKLDAPLPGGMDFSNYALSLCMVHHEHIIKDLCHPETGNRVLYEELRTSCLGFVDERTIQALGRFVMTNRGINNHSIEFLLEILRPIYEMKNHLQFIEMMGLKKEQKE